MVVVVHIKCQPTVGIKRGSAGIDPRKVACRLRGRAQSANEVALGIWLGRWFLLQTFDDDVECGAAEIRQLLDDSDEDAAPQCWRYFED